MIDPQRLLEQVLGGNVGVDARSAGRQIKQRLDDAGGARSFAGGALTGGLLGLLLGGKGARRMARGAFGYGGAAVLGALAMRAYQSYQEQQAGRAPAAQPFSSDAPDALPHAAPAADGTPFELVLVRAMVGAAKADGHVDAAEQRRLFAEVERLDLDPESKAYVFDLLTKDVDLASLARATATPEQGAELYLASRLVIDLDEPAERAYLDALASRLKIPADLRARLDHAG
jgi:uncharacterized membrane protein YebE (DUF533 family)